MDVELKGLFSLEGMPSVINGLLIVESDYIKTLEHCTSVITGPAAIKASNLTSLEGAPRSCHMFSVEADELETTYGISGSQFTSMHLVCKKLKSVEGLKGKNLETLYIRGANNCEIIDGPARCEYINIAPYKGMAKLMMAEGLKDVRLHGTGELMTHKYEELKAALAEMQLEPTGRKRRLMLEQAMIDMELEELL